MHPKFEIERRIHQDHQTWNRLGDNAEMCYIELVDFNELMLADAKPAAKKSRRSRRGEVKAADAQPATAAAVAEESVEDESTEAVALKL